MDAIELARASERVAREAFARAEQEREIHASLIRDVVALGRGLNPDECAYEAEAGDDGRKELEIKGPDGRTIARFGKWPTTDFDQTVKLVEVALESWRMDQVVYQDDPECVRAFLKRRDGRFAAMGEARNTQLAIFLALASAVCKELAFRAEAAEKSAPGAPAP